MKYPSAFQYSIAKQRKYHVRIWAEYYADPTIAESRKTIDMVWFDPRRQSRVTVDGIRRRPVSLISDN